MFISHIDGLREKIYGVISLFIENMLKHFTVDGAPVSNLASYDYGGSFLKFSWKYSLIWNVSPQTPIFLKRKNMANLENCIYVNAFRISATFAEIVGVKQEPNHKGPNDPSLGCFRILGESVSSFPELSRGFNEEGWEPFKRQWLSIRQATGCQIRTQGTMLKAMCSVASAIRTQAEKVEGNGRWKITHSGLRNTGRWSGSFGRYNDNNLEFHTFACLKYVHS